MDSKIAEDVFSKIPTRLPRFLLLILFVLLVVGFATFFSQIPGVSASRAWEIFLVNLLFFSGLSQAGLIFSAILRVADGRVSRPVLRIGEAMSSFLPVSFILFLLIFFLGREHIFPWIKNPIPHKEPWLNVPFLLGRNIIGIVLLYALSFAFLYYSLREDIGLIREKASGSIRGIYNTLTSGWKGEEEELKRCYKKVATLAPIVILVYAFVFSTISWDFVMSLDAHWFSTLFGPYFFIGAFFSALAAIAILAVILRGSLGLEKYIGYNQMRDLGQLLFGFSLFWTYLFWSQFLPIWYANLPEEIGFVIKRISEPYKNLSWAVISCGFFFPFLTLLPRKTKVTTWILSLISLVIFVGIWLERFVLVTPSLSPEGTVLGWMEVLITLGFLAAFSLMFLLFIRIFPIMPIGDPLFRERFESPHHGHHGEHG